MLRHREEHEVIRHSRAEQQTDTWKDRYAKAASPKGPTLRTAQIPLPGPGEGRPSVPKLPGAAINLARIDAHLTETPRADTRTSHFAALRPAEQVDGAKQELNEPTASCRGRPRYVEEEQLKFGSAARGTLSSEHSR